jgi:uncharacterized protein (DUF58 family)
MADIFDPHVVSRVKGLEVRSFRLAESLMMGIHKSRLRGISTEFAQHRQYVHGDDTKHLDWKVFAKTDRFFVKQYEAETNMPMYFFLDTSASMFFKSEEAALSKYEYASTVVATLAYLMMQQKDTFGVVLFDERIRSFLGAKGSGSHFRNTLDVMTKMQPGDKTDIGRAMLNASPQMKNKGVVVVISDFVDETDTLVKGLGQMSYMGHDVMLFHIEDPTERDFPFVGQTIFRGLEGEGRLLCDPEDLVGAYMRERERHLAAIREVCARFRYDLTDIATDERLDAILSGYLSNRLSRRRRR